MLFLLKQPAIVPWAENTFEKLNPKNTPTASQSGGVSDAMKDVENSRNTESSRKLRDKRTQHMGEPSEYVRTKTHWATNVTNIWGDPPKNLL